MTLLGAELAAVNCKPGKDGQHFLAGLLFLKGTTREIHEVSDVDKGTRFHIRIPKDLADGRRSWTLVAELELIR